MDITVVEVLDRILPAEDIDISNFALKSFEKQGIKIKTSSMVKSLKTSKDKISVQIETMAGSEEVSGKGDTGRRYYWEYKKTLD